MADYLINFTEGETITASATNSNNQYLLKRIGSIYESLQTWLEGKVGQIFSSIQSGDATLQKRIDALEEKLDSRVFTEKSLAVGIGTVDLSAYLPDDGLQYLVFINAKRQSHSATLTAATDIMVTPRLLYQNDSDYGRTSCSAMLATIPVGAERKLVLAGVADWINLCGYMKV